MKYREGENVQRCRIISRHRLGMLFDTGPLSSATLFLSARGLLPVAFSGRIDVPNTQSYGNIGKFNF